MELETYEALTAVATKIKSVKDSLEEKIAAIPMIKGEKGDKGDKGDKGERGKDGVNGKDGRNGRDGKDGREGKDGLDGSDGISVVDASVDFDGRLLIKLSNGEEIDAGQVVFDSEARNVHITHGNTVVEGASELTYTNLTPSTYAIGGLPIGTVFDNVPISLVLNGIFYGSMLPDNTLITSDGEPFTTVDNEYLVVQQ